MEPTLGWPETLPASWPEPIQLLGEGIEYHRAALSTAGFDDRLLPAETAVPRASALYQLGRRRADRGQFVPREALLPLYLRKPEAEEVWEKRQGASTDAKT
jgi:tRNA threonylcarbamoyladenosine biosynthesis protein TsaB